MHDQHPHQHHGGPPADGGPLRLRPKAVPARETAQEHLRNALQLLRVTLETERVEWPGVLVPAQTLAALQARLEAALDVLEPPRSPLPFPSREG